MAPEKAPDPLYACNRCGKEVRELDRLPGVGRIFKHAEETFCENGIRQAMNPASFTVEYILQEINVVAIPAKPQHAPRENLNPVGVTPGKDRYESGIHEVPCSVNPVALLRVTGLAERYLAANPDDKEDFQADVDACNRAGEIYNAVWEMVNGRRKP